MKPLSSHFTYDLFQFRQLARDGDVVLLEKSKPGHARPSYEVVIVQHHPAQTIRGHEYPEREALPPSESWGTLGWTFADLTSAQNRFHQIRLTALVVK